MSKPQVVRISHEELLMSIGEWQRYANQLLEALTAIDNSPNRVCQCWVIASGALTLPRPGEDK